MSEIDIFIFSTSFITLDHKKLLKNSTFVGNTGHFDNKIDFAHTEAFEGTEVDHIKHQKIVLVSPVGHSVIVMRRLKGFFELFTDFKKKKCGVRPPVRRSPARWKFPR